MTWITKRHPVIQLKQHRLTLCSRLVVLKKYSSINSVPPRVLRTHTCRCEASCHVHYTYMYIHTCTYIQHVHECIMCTCAHVCICVHTYMYTHVGCMIFLCIPEHESKLMYVCMYVCMIGSTRKRTNIQDFFP